MTKDQIKEKLTELGIAFEDGAKKEELEALLPPEFKSDSNEGEGENAPAVEKKTATTVARKPHWPKGFVPTGDKLKDTKALLDAEEKVSFMCPLAPEEKAGAEEIVQVNGWKYTIKKGHMVEVPRTIAAMLARKYRIEMEVMQRAQANASSEKARALAS